MKELPRKTTFHLREDLGPQIAASLAATAKLRESIAEVYPRLKNPPQLHTFSGNYLARSLARMGLNDEVAELRSSMLDAIKHNVLNDWDAFIQTTQLARGEFALAREHFDAKSVRRFFRQFFSLNRYIHMTVLNGDLEETDEVLATPGLIRSDRFFTAERYLAVFAHWFGEETLVERSLAWMRTWITHYNELHQKQQNELVVSEDRPVKYSMRPIEDDLEWLDGSVFAPMFLQTLACCGRGALAEQSWLGNNRERKIQREDILKFCRMLAMAGDCERALRIAERECVNEIPVSLYLNLCRGSIRVREDVAVRRYGKKYLACIQRDLIESLR